MAATDQGGGKGAVAERQLSQIGSGTEMIARLLGGHRLFQTFANMLTASLTNNTGIRLQPARRCSAPRARRAIVRPQAVLVPLDYG